MDTGCVEPWPEPVDMQALLNELTAQLRRYVVVHDDAAIAITLWMAFAWVHEIAVHSPLLIITSAEPDSGKSTLLGVLGFLTPRPYSAVELTGANIYRIVDHLHPTLLIDEADQLFHRKPALAEVSTRVGREARKFHAWYAAVRSTSSIRSAPRS